MSPVVSGKQLPWDSRVGGGGWELSLVQGSKIHLNELWSRLRVPGSQWHIPTQKFLKYPPGICKDGGVWGGSKSVPPH